MKDDDGHIDELFFASWLTDKSASVIFRAGDVPRGEARFITTHSGNLEIVVVITLILREWKFGGCSCDNDYSTG